MYITGTGDAQNFTKIRNYDGLIVYTLYNIQNSASVSVKAYPTFLSFAAGLFAYLIPFFVISDDGSIPYLIIRESLFYRFKNKPLYILITLNIHIQIYQWTHF